MKHRQEYGRAVIKLCKFDFYFKCRVDFLTAADCFLFLHRNTRGWGFFHSQHSSLVEYITLSEVRIKPSKQGDSRTLPVTAKKTFSMKRVASTILKPDPDHGREGQLYYPSKNCHAAQHNMAAVPLFLILPGADLFFIFFFFLMISVSVHKKKRYRLVDQSTVFALVCIHLCSLWQRPVQFFFLTSKKTKQRTTTKKHNKKTVSLSLSLHSPNHLWEAMSA